MRGWSKKMVLIELAQKKKPNMLGVAVNEIILHINYREF